MINRNSHHAPTIAKNAGWTLAGQFARLGLQALYFVVVGRGLGAESFGQFAAIQALALILGSLTALGAGNVLVMRVAAAPQAFKVQWGNALLVTLGGGIVGCALIQALHLYLFPNVSRATLLALSATELLFSRLGELTAQAYQAHERLADSARIFFSQSAVRLLAAFALFSVVPEATLSTWTLVYLCASAAVTIPLAIAVSVHYGAPSFDAMELRSAVRVGSYFAASGAANTTLNDADKVVLSRAVSSEAAGTYAAAYRVAILATLPIRSLLTAAYPRFFKVGTEGPTATLTFALRLLRVSFAAGVVSGILLFLFAPALPYVLGEDFRSSIRTTQWLALLPLIQALHLVAADALSASAHHVHRAVTHVSIALTHVLACVIVIPSWSSSGAIAVAILSDLTLAAALWLLVGRLLRKPNE